MCGEKIFCPFGGVEKWGITPACAGKSIINQTIHYHTCGSPPRMRGKEPFAKMSLKPGRITPAYAGKSTSLSATKWQKKDHPRVCGEKMSFRSWIVSGLGSPPRMRGKAVKLYVTSASSRITPAYAGKRRFQFIGRRVYEDHPRVCGEKLTTFDSGKLIPGSPPRMRGKVTHGYSAKPVCRITPAYAGKRSTGVQGPRPL